MDLTGGDGSLPAAPVQLLVLHFGPPCLRTLRSAAHRPPSAELIPRVSVSLCACATAARGQTGHTPLLLHSVLQPSLRRRAPAARVRGQVAPLQHARRAVGDA